MRTLLCWIKIYVANLAVRIYSVIPSFNKMGTVYTNPLYKNYFDVFNPKLHLFLLSHSNKQEKDGRRKENLRQQAEGIFYLQPVCS